MPFFCANIYKSHKIFKTMTKLLTSFLCFIAIQFSLSAQNIPDPNFAAAIRQQCPNCINSNNNLTPSAASLQTLIVNSQYIDSLDGIGGFTSLRRLECGSNRLTTLPALPSTLEQLICPSNQLTILPTLPNRLKVLHCFDNLLDSLPAMPDSLDILYCYENRLTNLPALPNRLINLRVQNNLLNSLPALPDSLLYLNCSNNLFDSLPTMPDSLIWLYCGNNRLTTLPILSTVLQDLNCANNQISILPDLPVDLRILDISGNNAVRCLPYLPVFFSTLNATSTSVRCLPNWPRYLHPTPNLVLCDDVNNWYNCPTFTHINEELGINNSLKIIPNPNNGIFSVQRENVSTKPVNVLIYNQFGQLVYSQNNLLSDNSIDINLNHLNAGVYRLQVIDERAISSQSLIIAK